MEKASDLVKFVMVKGLNSMRSKLLSSSELSSDHKPIIINYFKVLLLKLHIDYPEVVLEATRSQEVTTIN